MTRIKICFPHIFHNWSSFVWMVLWLFFHLWHHLIVKDYYVIRLHKADTVNRLHEFETAHQWVSPRQSVTRLRNWLPKIFPLVVCIKQKLLSKDYHVSRLHKAETVNVLQEFETTHQRILGQPFNRILCTLIQTAHQRISPQSFNRI